MKYIRSRTRQFLFSILLGAAPVGLFSFMSRAQPNPAPSPDSNPAPAPAPDTNALPATVAPVSGEMVKELNFANAPIDQIIQLYAQLTGRTAIYPSNIQARIVLQANGPLTKVKGVEGMSSSGFSISPDGRYLLYTKLVSSGSDLMLVENFK